MLRVKWRRRLFNLAAAVALLLCVATCLLWVRSYLRFDRVSVRTDGGRFVGAYSASGRVELNTTDGWPQAWPLRWNVGREGEFQRRRVGKRDVDIKVGPDLSSQVQADMYPLIFATLDATKVAHWER